MRLLSRWIPALAVLGALCLPAREAVAAESGELRISRQPSILYLQTVLMEDGKLAYAHVRPTKTNWAASSR